jgi:hypothetical protein
LILSFIVKSEGLGSAYAGVSVVGSDTGSGETVDAGADGDGAAACGAAVQEVTRGRAIRAMAASN